MERLTSEMSELEGFDKVQLDIGRVSTVLRDHCSSKLTGTNLPQAIAECLIIGRDDFARGGVRDDIALLVGVVGAAEGTRKGMRT